MNRRQYRSRYERQRRLDRQAEWLLAIMPWAFCVALIGGAVLAMVQS